MILRGFPRLAYTTAGVNIIADGNSLTAGLKASGPSAYWPAQAATMAPLVGPGLTIRNVAVSGQGIILTGGPSTMMARAPSQVDANLVAGKTNVLFAFEYTNEIKFAFGDGAAVHSNMRTYCLARKAAAASAGKTLHIIVITAPPALYGNNTQETVNAWNEGLKVANNLMRQHYREYADQIGDLAGLPPFASIFNGGIYTAPIFQAPGLYFSDNAHFTDTGYRYIASFMATLLKRVRAR